MDPLLLELAKLQKDGNLKQSIDDVDKIIEQLERARETIVAGKRPISSEPAVVEVKLVLSRQLLILTRSKLCLDYSCKITESAKAWIRQSER
jgi:hypothetical protein